MRHLNLTAIISSAMILAASVVFLITFGGRARQDDEERKALVLEGYLQGTVRCLSMVDEAQEQNAPAAALKVYAYAALDVYERQHPYPEGERKTFQSKVVNTLGLDFTPDAQKGLRDMTAVHVNNSGIEDESVRKALVDAFVKIMDKSK